MVAFYQDIVERIANHLQHDKFSLANLRLVSSLWDAPCLSLLFRRLEFVILDPFDFVQEGLGDEHCPADPVSKSLKRCEDLLALFHAQPNLANVPKEFSLVRAHRFRPSFWDQLECVHTSIFRQLKFVQEVDFREVHFSHLSKDCVDALLEILRQPTVTHLTMNGCTFDDIQTLHQVVLSSEYLQHLKLFIFATFLDKDTPSDNDLESEKEDGDTEGLVVLAGYQPRKPQRRQARLKTLDADHRSLIFLYRCLLDPQSGLDLSELRELRIAHAGNSATLSDYIAAAMYVYAACATSLNLLVVESPSGGCTVTKDQVQGRKLLSQLCNVTTMTFDGIFFSKQQTKNTIAIIAESISLTDQRSRLATLAIRSNVQSTKGNSIDWTCWAPLDDALSNRLIFPFFEYLDICLCIRDGRYTDNHMKLLKKQFPKMLARGCLKVSVDA